MTHLARTPISFVGQVMPESAGTLYLCAIRILIIIRIIVIQVLWTTP